MKWLWMSLFLLCVSLMLIGYADQFDTVIRWQAEGLCRWKAYATDTWQEWWTYNPYEVAAYCWSSVSSWLQFAAAMASLYGLWREH